MATLSVNQALAVLDEAFCKTRKIMEGFPNVKFSAEEYQRFYECVYLSCVQKSCAENANILHARYKNGLEESIFSLVLPSLENKNGVFLLSELMLKWSSYQVMAKWLSRFFDYLDRFYLPRIGACGLLEQAFKYFHDVVDAQFHTKFIAATISLINQDRNGEKIDWILLQNVVEYFRIHPRVGGSLYLDFQKVLFEDAAAYYSQIAFNGLMFDSCADYMNKVQWLLNQENERAGRFLDESTREKLLQVVNSHLVDLFLSKLNEKQQAEKCGQLTDYQDLLSKCADLKLGDHGSGSQMEG